MKHTLMTAALSLALSAGVAQAHATLETPEAPVESNYKAVMRIGHGCSGEATLRLRITIPEGVINAKPMPKAGWKLETVTGPYARTYEYHGPRSEGVKEIIWTGKLENEHYDEFIFRARITDAFEPGQIIYFPTVQECATGENAWTEIPAEGQTRRDLKRPAPGLTVLGKAEHSH
ncbi:MAG: hypothetical protein CR993_07855 [Rhodobacterales bacterium]|nr:MAG: hypothetical protein CR993_07855 [Rhodobacterales bacterium]